MKKIKLMVIDDNKEFCTLVKEYAKITAYIKFCGAAHDGIEGMKMIRETHPDIIILDSVMPQLNGIGVMKHLQNTPKELRPKVVAITASMTTNYITLMYKLGANYVISKNSGITEMLERCLLISDPERYIEKQEQLKLSL